jgi:DNA-directed RNA polymerase specialized sigma24 family protein
MMRRIIGNQAAQMSDERLKQISELVAARMQASLALEGEQPVDLSLIADAARTVTEIKDPAQREAVMRYISALHEPQRTIFLKRRAGWRAKEIAAACGLELKSVCASLAKMYSDLRQIINSQETSV